MLHDFSHAAPLRCNYGQTTSHRFYQRDPKAFRMRRLDVEMAAGAELSGIFRKAGQDYAPCEMISNG